MFVRERKRGRRRGRRKEEVVEREGGRGRRGKERERRLHPKKLLHFNPFARLLSLSSVHLELQLAKALSIAGGERWKRQTRGRWTGEKDEVREWPRGGSGGDAFAPLFSFSPPSSFSVAYYTPARFLRPFRESTTRCSRSAREQDRSCLLNAEKRPERFLSLPIAAGVTVRRPKETKHLLCFFLSYLDRLQGLHRDLRLGERGARVHLGWRASEKDGERKRRGSGRTKAKEEL